VARRLANKRPTSQDVADLAGVSVTTVSFVINDKSGGNVRISEETRKKVWEAVEALHYRPSSAARSLRTKRSNLLALMIPHIEPPYHPLLAAAVQREAEQGNLDVIIYSTRDELQRERDFLNVLISRAVDGVIIHSHQLSGDDIDSLVEAGIAVVVHGNSPTHPYVDNVMIDEVKAAEEAVSYLIDKGHVRIGTIAGPEATWDGRLRKDGYLNALQAHGIPVEDELICEVDFFREGAGASGMKKFLSLPEPPSAIFAASDHIAVEALLHAVDCGLTVPEDVAIVGFDNTPTATRIRPRLTTIHKDVNVLGSTAVQLLVERINSEDSLPSRQKIIEHKLVCRGSA
jgi:LacI family transcriptional regulator